MKRKKKLQPLQKQLVHLLLIFVICVLSIIVWSISDYIKLQNKNLENTLELYAGHLAQTARQSYTSYENIAYSVAYNTLVQDYIQENDSVKRYEAYQQVYNLLSNTSKLNSYLADITIIGSDGNSISLTASPSLYDCYEDVLSTPSYAFCSMGTLNIRGTNCHILSMPVHKLSSSGRSQYLGTVFLAINSEHFFAASIADERNENIPEVSELSDSVQKALTILEKQNEPAPVTETAPSVQVLSRGNFVSAMIDYINSHYMEDISIQTLADLCSINPNYAGQLFKQKINQTFNSYLSNFRIQKAEKLLVDTDMPIALVAASVGYQDYFYFAKVFKKLTGSTPSSYRHEDEPSL